MRRRYLPAGMALSVGRVGHRRGTHIAHNLAVCHSGVYQGRTLLTSSARLEAGDLRRVGARCLQTACCERFPTPADRRSSDGGCPSGWDAPLEIDGGMDTPGAVQALASRRLFHHVSRDDTAVGS